MLMARRDQKELDEIRTMSQEIARLTGQIAALVEQRDSSQELNELKDRIEEKKRESERLTEEHGRKIRDITHEVGLLKIAQEQDAEHQKREITLAEQTAVLKVREENLSADQARFKGEMDFQREQTRTEIGGLRTLVAQLLDRLPVIDVELSSPVYSTVRRASKDDHGS
jgi:actin-related protein